MSCNAPTTLTYTPRRAVILTITNALNAVVTTTAPNTFIEGEIVRLYIPPNYGMEAIDRMITIVSPLNDTDFVTEINTLNLGTFNLAPPTGSLCPQVIPIGEINSILDAATRNVLGD